MDPIILRTTLATLIACMGGWLGVVLSRAVARYLSLLVCAATGVLLAVTLCDILPEAKQGLAWPVFLLAAGSGYAVFWLVGKYVYHLCPACSLAALDDGRVHIHGQTALLLVIALGLHSLMDGVAVVVGDEMGAGHTNLGVLMAISVHKLPEGMALALLLLGAGYRRRNVLWWTLGIEAATELGGLLGLWFLQGASISVLRLLFAHTGGGFLYLVVSACGAFAAPGNRPAVRRMLVVSGLAFAAASVLLLVTRGLG